MNPNKSYVPVKERRHFGDQDNAVPANVRPRGTENQALLMAQTRPPEHTRLTRCALDLQEIATQPNNPKFKIRRDRPVRPLSGLRLLKWIGKRMPYPMTIPDVEAVLSQAESIEKRRAEFGL